MKTIKVNFPDGVRDWPAQERFLHSSEIPPGPVQTILEPMPDPDWRFQPIVGGWRATPRN